MASRRLQLKKQLVEKILIANLQVQDAVARIEREIEEEEEEEVVEEDMSDPATWLPGDIIKCVSNRNCHFTPNRKYVFKELTHNDKNDTYAHVENDDEGDPNGLRVDFFEWHSRPL